MTLGSVWIDSPSGELEGQAERERASQKNKQEGSVISERWYEASEKEIGGSVDDASPKFWLVAERSVLAGECLFLFSDGFLSWRFFSRGLFYDYLFSRRLLGYYFFGRSRFSDYFLNWRFLGHHLFNSSLLSNRLFGFYFLSRSFLGYCLFCGCFFYGHFIPPPLFRIGGDCEIL